MSLPDVFPNSPSNFPVLNLWSPSAPNDDNFCAGIDLIDFFNSSILESISFLALGMSALELPVFARLHAVRFYRLHPG